LGDVHSPRVAIREDVYGQVQLVMQSAYEAARLSGRLPAAGNQQRLVLVVDVFFDEPREKGAFLDGYDFVGFCVNELG
jgi:hypothetical protein